MYIIGYTLIYTHPRIFMYSTYLSNTLFACDPGNANAKIVRVRFAQNNSVNPDTIVYLNINVF